MELRNVLLTKLAMPNFPKIIKQGHFMREKKLDGALSCKHQFSFNVSDMNEEEFWAKIHASEECVRRGEYITLAEFQEKMRERRLCVTRY